MEEHIAETPDGWSLVLIRIPHGKNGTRNGRVVFFQHGTINAPGTHSLSSAGLTDSANGCTLNNPTESFPYILADQGCADTPAHT